MGKRANAKKVTDGTAAKKAKLEPGLAVIADAIMGAEHVPKRCRAMLTELLPLSLSYPSDERHLLQTMAVDMMEETFQGTKSELEAAIANEEATLEKLKGSEGDLVDAVKRSEDALAGQVDAVETAKKTLAEATVLEQEAATVLNGRVADHKAIVDKLSRAQEAKSALESAFEAHFKPIEVEGSGSHFKELEPLLKQIEIEATLLSAVPSVCVKAKSARGRFDDLVIEELGQAIKSKIVALGEEVVADTPNSTQLEAAAKAAETEHEAKKVAQSHCSIELDAALKEQNERETTLNQARTAVDEFSPQVDAVTGRVSDAKSALQLFETGPSASFTSYKTKLAALPETMPEAVPDVVPEASPEKSVPEVAHEASPVLVAECGA